ASSTNKLSNYSFPYALKYAVLYNPTAPILDPTGVSPVSGGPYFEQSLFDLYNPVGMLKQNTYIGKLNTINLSGKLDFDVVPVKGLTGTIAYSLQHQQEWLGQ